jgi:hypothetical protein
MNTPLRKIGMNEGQAVYLLNGRETDLHCGFNPSCVYLGSEQDPATGEFRQVFAPTRRARRAGLQKQNRIRNFGKHTFVQAVKSKENGLVKFIRQTFAKKHK